MRILVTGGAGFIGSHIVDAYIEDGHTVTIIDDLSTGNDDNVNPRATFLKMDINDKKISSIFEKYKFDVVNHHAAQINVRTSLSDPVRDASTNVLGSVNLLTLGAQNNIRRFIFASSGGAIYGEPKSYPITETCRPDPMSPYAIAKLATENYIRVLARLHDFDYVILRYSNVYGPRQISKSEAGVISIFINQILKGEECFVNGDGNQTRDYVYVKDVVRANILALQCGSDFFNIGTKVETSVNQLINNLGEITGREIRHKHRAAIPGEVLRNVLDYSKVRRKLKWSPKVPLKEGIKRTYDYFAVHNEDNKKISRS